MKIFTLNRARSAMTWFAVITGQFCWRLMSVILATWEAEIRRTAFRGKQIVHKIPSPK
jgi:hypothetical protein